MKIVLQRVLNAKVTVSDEIIGQIDQGLLVFLGVEKGDFCDMLEKMAEKIIRLRIFADENGKTNLALNDVGGSLLIVSQFTLCADLSHGHRPGFTNAMDPKTANEMYEKFIAICSEKTANVQHGEFGADMRVDLSNDGPFTIVMEEHA